MINRTQLKPFQVAAVKEISESFINLWRTQNYKLPLIFKSPNRIRENHNDGRIPFIYK